MDLRPDTRRAPIGLPWEGRKARWILGVLGFACLVVLIACPIPFLSFVVSPSPIPQYRFPFPAERPLTERDAIELSKQALIADGKQTDTMRPVASGHQDREGRDIYFYLTRAEAPENGWVLWWLERPECTWEYSVGIHRDGDEVVCAISRPK